MESRNITFCQADLSSTSFAAFEDMRKRGELCDLTIKVEDCTIVAHRVIVAAGIPYFRSHFMTPATENEEIPFGDLDPSALESLIHFVYSSEVNISVDNVQSLLVASHFLGLIQVQDACVQFLSQIMCANNVVQVRTLADSLNNTNLIEISNKYMINNFGKFSKTDEFLRLPHSVIKQIIAEDDLVVSGEEIVFEAVINWVKSSPLQREAVLPELLSEVRLISLPLDFLIKKVASDELVKTSKPGCALIEEVKYYHLLPKETSLFQNVKTTPRKCDDRNNDLYAICNDSRSDRICVRRCNFMSNTWQDVASCEGKEDDAICSAVTVNDKIFLFLRKNIRTFHTKTLAWETLEPKYGDFTVSAILLFGNKIFCFGCLDPSFCKKVRCFDVNQNMWFTKGPMERDYRYAAAASVEECIYVLGGWLNCQTLNAVRKYHPPTDLWIEMAPMLSPRDEHSCAYMNGRIYVCGGYNGKEKLSSAEVYDTLRNQWDSISCMENARVSFSLIPHRGKIYALGGRRHEDRDECEVEMYDPVGDQWNSRFKVPEGFRFALSAPRASF